MRTKNKYWGKPVSGPRHPYVEYEGTLLWRAARKALADLENNEDLTISEWHQYVVGYLCKQLASKGLVNRRAVQQVMRRRRAV
jgi:hypothetical protein